MNPRPFNFYKRGSWMPSVIALAIAWVLAEIIYQTGGGLWAKHVAAVGTVALGLIILATELALLWRKRRPRFHQDWWDSDGTLLECSSPRQHDRFNR